VIETIQFSIKINHRDNNVIIIFMRALDHIYTLLHYTYFTDSIHNRYVHVIIWRNPVLAESLAQIKVFTTTHIPHYHMYKVRVYM
jgi:hypothetical protein